MKKFVALAAVIGLALSAPVAMAQSVDDAVAAVNATVDVSTVAGIATVGEITVVTTGTLEGDAALLDAAVAANEAGITALRDAIAANAALAAALEAQGVAIDTVVGLTVTDVATGAITVYVTG